MITPFLSSQPPILKPSPESVPPLSPILLSLPALAATLFLSLPLLAAADSPPPTPAFKAPARMLSVEGLSSKLSPPDFSRLPHLPSERIVVTDVRTAGGVTQHLFLARFLNRYWLMWSAGPGLEDRVGQRVSFSLSEDGRSWSAPAFLTPEPPISGPGSPHYNTRSLQGFRWIARGFWNRRGELLALASLDEAGDAFGPSLQVRAFRLDPKTDGWEDAGPVWDGGVNLQPPQQLSDGTWMFWQQPSPGQALQLRTCSQPSPKEWQTHPGPAGSLAADAPVCWELPGGKLAAFFQDHQGTGWISRALSTSGGRQWTAPMRTNFPSAPANLRGARLADGRYALLSHPNPASRDPLTLSLSSDGLQFTRMFSLVQGREVDGAFLLEDQDTLLVAVSEGKQTVEILRIHLPGLDVPPAVSPPGN